MLLTMAYILCYNALLREGKISDMKLKYRIKQWQYPFAKTAFTAQYKILGIWLNINANQVGRLSKTGTILCETFEQAQKRIEKHKTNMERAGEVWCRYSHVVWEG